MLETARAQAILDIRGLNEQLNLLEPATVARLRGTYPYKKGLQARVPGKTLIQKFDYPINGIAVFYNVYGRRYMLWDGLDITIEEVEWDFDFQWEVPWYPDGYDTFETYQTAPIFLFYGGYFPGSQSVGQIVKRATSIWDTFEDYSLGTISILSGGGTDFPALIHDGTLGVFQQRLCDDFEEYALGQIIIVNGYLGLDGEILYPADIELVVP